MTRHLLCLGPAGLTNPQILLKTLVVQGFFADFPTRFTGDAQTVQVGFNAVVEFRQIVEVVMGLGDSGVTQEPEEKAASSVYWVMMSSMIMKCVILAVC